MSTRTVSDTTACSAVFVPADPSDGNGSRAVLARLAAAESGHRVVVGCTDDAVAVADALRAGAGGWLFASPVVPTPTPTPTPVCGPRRRWYPVVASGGEEVRLSARELNVLQGVADGHTLSRIARDLGLSTLTVRNHITRAGQKLGARSRGQLVLLALRAEVIR